MIKQFRVVLGLALGLIAFPLSPMTTAADAWQCTEIVEYVEMWDDADDANATLKLYAKGIADAGGEPCSVTIRTYITNPSGTEIASTYGSGSGYATSTAIANISNGAAGQYNATTEAWSQGVHYGCAASQGDVSIIVSNYQRTGSTSTMCYYGKCGGGNCSSAKMKKSSIPEQVCHQYSRLHALRIAYGPLSKCWHAWIASQTSCVFGPEANCA